MRLYGSASSIAMSPSSVYSCFTRGVVAGEAAEDCDCDGTVVVWFVG